MRHRYNELEVQRRVQELVLLAFRETPVAPSQETLAQLLDALPHGTLHFQSMPGTILRGLCEAFGIQIAYHRHRHNATLTAEISADTGQPIQTGEISDDLWFCLVPSAGL